MKLSFAKKLFAILLFWLILITLSMSYFCSYELEKYYKNILMQRLEIQLQEIKFLLLNTSLSVSPAGLDDAQLKTFAKTSDVRLTLIDTEGTVIFDSMVGADSLRYLQNHLDRPEIQIAKHKGTAATERMSATLSRSMLYAAYRLDVLPLNPYLRKLKYIRIAMPTAKVNKALFVLQCKIYIGAALALIIMSALSYWASKRFTAPIVKLTEAAESVKKGALDVHFTKTSHDEVGELADLLNEMLDKLRNDMIQLRRLEQVRNQFLGNVSHELRTPIFAIQGYLETLLHNQNCDTETQLTFIDKAFKQSTRLNDLLRDLIDISRIESGEMKMSYNTFALHTWLEKIVMDFQPLAQENGITLNYANSEKNDAVRISADPQKLTQVMSNLITNAIKYNVPAGRVGVNYTVNEKSVTIFVSDTGRGIAPEHLDRIFERFYRVDKERSRAVGGTGLGLAIVKHIVEAHKSRIRVESDVGQGSTFSFDVKKVEEHNYPDKQTLAAEVEGKDE